MSQSSIPAGHALARKAFGVALFARTIQAPGFCKNLVGEAPQQAAAEAKLKGQTAPDMPFVRVTDLSKSQGDAVTVDIFDTISGSPLMGDVNAEGKGSKLNSSTQEIKIDLMTKVVDAGGKMSNQRSVHNLRGIAMAQLAGYFPRLKDQQAIVHLAGARGSMAGKDWVLPQQYVGTALQSDFTDIMVNQVKAPTYNRHFVVDSTGLIQGGLRAESLDANDVWTLDRVDEISVLLDDMEFPLQSVKVADDPAANDDLIKGILYLTPRQWNQIKTATSGNVWRTFLQNAWNRKSYGSKHPLFSGEPGLWNGLLIRQLPRWTIRFAGGDKYQYVAVADKLSAAETQGTIPTVSGYAVERAILLGAQALADVYGKNANSGYYFSWHERPYNFDRALEVAGDCMGGMAKLRFNLLDGNGDLTPTDNGVIAIDSIVKV
jgi:N4-gp56 family major capsid protein